METLLRPRSEAYRGAVQLDRDMTVEFSPSPGGRRTGQSRVRRAAQVRKLPGLHDCATSPVRAPRRGSQVRRRRLEDAMVSGMNERLPPEEAKAMSEALRPPNPLIEQWIHFEALCNYNSRTVELEARIRHAKVFRKGETNKTLLRELEVALACQTLDSLCETSLDRNVLLYVREILFGAVFHQETEPAEPGDFDTSPVQQYARRVKHFEVAARMTRAADGLQSDRLAETVAGLPKEEQRAFWGKFMPLVPPDDVHDYAAAMLESVDDDGRIDFAQAAISRTAVEEQQQFVRLMCSSLKAEERNDVFRMIVRDSPITDQVFCLSDLLMGLPIDRRGHALSALFQDRPTEERHSLFEVMVRHLDVPNALDLLDRTLQTRNDKERISALVEYAHQADASYRVDFMTKMLTGIGLLPLESIFKNIVGGLEERQAHLLVEGVAQGQPETSRRQIAVELMEFLSNEARFAAMRDLFNSLPRSECVHVLEWLLVLPPDERLPPLQTVLLQLGDEEKDHLMAALFKANESDEVLPSYETEVQNSRMLNSLLGALNTDQKTQAVRWILNNSQGKDYTELLGRIKARVLAVHLPDSVGAIACSGKVYEYFSSQAHTCLTVLENMLNEAAVLQDMRQLYQASTSTDPATLLKMWLTFHLRRAVKEDSSLPNRLAQPVDTLASHRLQTGEEYAVFFSMLGRSVKREAFERDTERDRELKDLRSRALKVGMTQDMRIELLYDCASRLMGVPEPLMQWDYLAAGDVNAHFVLLATLFLLKPSLQVRQTFFDDEKNMLEETQEMWRQLDLRHENKMHITEEQIELITQRMVRASRMVNAACSGVSEGDRLYRQAAVTVSAQLLNHLGMLSRGQSSFMDDSNTAESEPFQHVDPKAIADLLQLEEKPGEQVKVVERLLQENTHMLRRIYKAYAAMGGRATAINLPEYRMMVRDIRVISPIFSESQADMIFVVANQDVEPDGVVEISANSEDDLVPDEYIQALIRIASARFARSGLRESLRPLGECFEYFMVEHLLPHAYRSDAVRFRRLMGSPDIQLVFKKHRRPLEAVFEKYATIDPRYAAYPDSMQLCEWVAFLKAKRALTTTFTERMAARMFNYCQDIQTSNETDQAESDMDFDEFKEALVGCAVIRNPDPYIAVEQRLESLIKHMLMGEERRDIAALLRKTAAKAATAAKSLKKVRRPSAITNAKGAAAAFLEAAINEPPPPVDESIPFHLSSDDEDDEDEEEEEKREERESPPKLAVSLSRHGSAHSGLTHSAASGGTLGTSGGSLDLSRSGLSESTMSNSSTGSNY